MNKKRGKIYLTIGIIAIIILLVLGALYLSKMQKSSKLPTLPSTEGLKNTGFNLEFTDSKMGSAPITGNSVSQIIDSEGKWNNYLAKYYGYNNVWLWSSSGKLRSQTCWLLNGTEWKLISDWCTVNLTNAYLYLNTTVYYQNYSEYQKENWTWTNNSWSYIFGGFFLVDNQSNWYYIDSSWVYFEDNWKSLINNGNRGTWNNYNNSFETKTAGSDYFAEPSWILAKNFWLNNQSGSNYISNDTWINLGETYGIYNKSNIYHWNSWYFMAENNWTWTGNTWQNWDNVSVWKSSSENYYFMNSTIWIQDSWKIKSS